MIADSSKPNKLGNVYAIGSTTRNVIKVYIKGPGHMTKMAAWLLIPENDFNETWYVASGSLYKSWPWVDLDLFNGKIIICHIGVVFGKSVNIVIF